ncbi:MAG: type II toxin-antitoxin system RelB/DinJ family antitoxin [Burkholderiales bacterium]|nr:type II toxin-antitoxin system RelB/DinJ family antitoxin [Burkholderiales bacterium]
MLSSKKNIRSGQVHIALGENLKKEAESLLNEMGLTISEAVRVFLRTVVMEREIPFSVRYSTKIPNSETREAIAELERGNGKDVTLAELKTLWESD